ncbi:MAG: spore cortex biosynthesis protein YabQ [Christensenellales bacterium]
MTVNVPYQTLGALVCLGVGATAGLCFFCLSLFKFKKAVAFIIDFLITAGSFALFIFCLQKTQNGDIKFYHVAIAAAGFLLAFCPLKKLSSFVAVRKKLKADKTTLKA